MEKKDKMSSKTVAYSPTNDFKETLDLIEKLLELHIGDEGRLIYIKNSLKKGRNIYKGDKNYLKKWREKIKEINIENKKSFHLTEDDTRQELDVVQKIQGNSKQVQPDDKGPLDLQREQRPQGILLTQAEVISGELILTLSDATQLNLGNVIGPQGETGSPGNIGLLGPPGPQGVHGPQGHEGPQGEQGQEGPQGHEGLQGEQGQEGPQGKTGPPGPLGKKGPLGPPGPQGDKGPQGILGDKGETGPLGILGDKGPLGPPGDKGPQGILGDKGIQGPPGPQGNIGPLGPQGVQGPPGKQGPQGITLTQAEVISGELILTLSDATQLNLGNVIGPQGETGSPGPQGNKGSLGPQGNKGSLGPQGDKGPQGSHLNLRSVN